MRNDSLKNMTEDKKKEMARGILGLQVRSEEYRDYNWVLYLMALDVHREETLRLTR